MNLTQVIRGQASTLTLTVYQDGTAADEGTATFVTKDLDGNTIDSLAVTDNSDGTYEVTVPIKTDLALLEAYLSFDTGTILNQGHIEIVGNVLFTEAQARAFDAARFSTASRFSDAEIAEERIRITNWLETQTGVSWVPRFRRVVLRGNGSDRISLRDVVRGYGASDGAGSSRDVNAVLAATIDGTAVSTGNIEIDGPYLWLTSGVWSRPTRGANVVIDLEYGKTTPMAGADRIALIELSDRLPTSRTPRTAVSGNDEFGSYGWDPQNNGRPSRIPESNAWCRDNDMRLMLA